MRKWVPKVLCSFFVYGLHLVLAVPCALYPFALLALPAIAVASIVLKRIFAGSPSWRQALGYGWASLAVVSFVSYNKKIIDAVSPMILLAALVAPVPVLIARRSRGFGYAGLALLAAPLFPFALAMPVAVIPYAGFLALCVYVFRAGALESHSSLSLHLAASALLAGSFAAVFGASSPFEGGTRKALGEHARAIHLFPRNTRNEGAQFLAEDCEGRNYYLGTFRGLARLPLEGLSSEMDIDPFYLFRGRTSTNAAMDCGTDRAYVGNLDFGRVYAFEGEARNPARIFTAPEARRPAVLRLFEGMDLLFVAYEDDDDVTVLRATDLSRVATLEGVGGWDLAVDPSRRLLISSRRATVTVTRLDGFEKAASFNLHGLLSSPLPSLSTSLAVDPSRGRLFVGAMFTGEVLVFDLDRLAFVKKREIKTGIRFLEFDEGRGVLYASNGFDGNLYVLDPTCLDVLARIYVGHGTGPMGLGVRSGKLLVGSAAGALEVDVDGALGKAPGLDYPCELRDGFSPGGRPAGREEAGGVEQAGERQGGGAAEKKPLKPRE